MYELNFEKDKKASNVASEHLDMLPDQLAHIPEMNINSRLSGNEEQPLIDETARSLTGDEYQDKIDKVQEMLADLMKKRDAKLRKQSTGVSRPIKRETFFQDTDIEDINLEQNTRYSQARPQLKNDPLPFHESQRTSMQDGLRPQ